MLSLKPTKSLYALLTAAVLVACGEQEAIDSSRYAPIDSVIGQIKENLAEAGNLREIVDIDHARLAEEAGSPMGPARVVIFSDPELETALISENPLAALDLPLRVLSYEDAGAPALIYNAFDYLVSRYALDSQSTEKLRARYEDDIAAATAGVAQEIFAEFSTDTMEPDGIITIDSPFDFEETVERINRAIDSQGDTVHFGVVDFQANASELGLSILPSRMILFGGPGPGGKAMASAPTLGLDAFCQKFLIWQDEEGAVHLSFNDLLALADRQEASKSPALRVINFRLKKTFGDALKEG